MCYITYMLLRDFIVLDKDWDKIDGFEAVLEFIVDAIWKAEGPIFPKIVDRLREMEK